MRELILNRSPNSRLADSALAARLRAAALRPAASYAFLFWRGECIENGMERQGEGRARIVCLSTDPFLRHCYMVGGW